MKLNKNLIYELANRYSRAGLWFLVEDDDSKKDKNPILNNFYPLLSNHNPEIDMGILCGLALYKMEPNLVGDTTIKVPMKIDKLLNLWLQFQRYITSIVKQQIVGRRILPADYNYAVIFNDLYKKTAQEYLNNPKSQAHTVQGINLMITNLEGTVDEFYSFMASLRVLDYRVNVKHEAWFPQQFAGAIRKAIGQLAGNQMNVTDSVSLQFGQEYFSPAVIAGSVAYLWKQMRQIDSDNFKPIPPFEGRQQFTVEVKDVSKPMVFKTTKQATEVLNKRRIYAQVTDSSMEEAIGSTIIWDEFTYPYQLKGILEIEAGYNSHNGMLKNVQILRNFDRKGNDRHDEFVDPNNKDFSNFQDLDKDGNPIQGETCIIRIGHSSIKCHYPPNGYKYSQKSSRGNKFKIVGISPSYIIVQNINDHCLFVIDNRYLKQNWHGYNDKTGKQFSWKDYYRYKFLTNPAVKGHLEVGKVYDFDATYKTELEWFPTPELQAQSDLRRHQLNLKRGQGEVLPKWFYTGLDHPEEEKIEPEIWEFVRNSDERDWEELKQATTVPPRTKGYGFDERDALRRYVRGKLYADQPQEVDVQTEPEPEPEFDPEKYMKYIIKAK